jgi:hypothetical protein
MDDNRVDGINVVGPGQEHLEFERTEGSIRVVNDKGKPLGCEEGEAAAEFREAIAVHKDPVPVRGRCIVERGSSRVARIDNPATELGKRLTRNHTL